MLNRLTMEPDAPARTSALIEAGRAGLRHFEAAGYRRSEPPILLPSAAFLELLGEELRGRLLLTGEGDAYCLRPEYTIPVCREYLAGPHSGHPAQVCYFGPVFRGTRDGPSESRQVGLESLGRDDREAA